MTPDMLGLTATEQAVDRAMLCVEAALALGGTVTPSTQTGVQNAIDLIRAADGDAQLLSRLEAIAAELHIIATAHFHGRPNLCASRQARLRRSLLH